MGHYKKFYYVRGDVFESNASDKKNNALFRVTTYCKKNNIELAEIKELRNDTELNYFKMLEQKYGADAIRTHYKEVLLQSFINKNGDEIPKVEIDIPFVYNDENGETHYEMIIHSIYDISNELIVKKSVFDNTRKDHYLKLLWADKGNQIKEFKIGDYKEICKYFRTIEHKKQLKEYRAIKERERYDRLVALREQGKITDNQRKELYKLEEKYGKKD